MFDVGTNQTVCHHLYFFLWVPRFWSELRRKHSIWTKTENWQFGKVVFFPFVKCKTKATTNEKWLSNNTNQKNTISGWWVSLIFFLERSLRWHFREELVVSVPLLAWPFGSIHQSALSRANYCTWYSGIKSWIARTNLQNRTSNIVVLPNTKYNITFKRAACLWNEGLALIIGKKKNISCDCYAILGRILSWSTFTVFSCCRITMPNRRL